MKTNKGFTAIEMIVVVSIVIMLVAMVSPSVFRSLKVGRVSEAANSVMTVMSQAKQLARTHQSDKTPDVYYGVLIDCTSSPVKVSLTYGSLASRDYAQPLLAVKTPWNDYAGYAAAIAANAGILPAPPKLKPVYQLTWNRNVKLKAATADYNKTIWFGFTPRTARVVVLDPGTNNSFKVTDIGTIAGINNEWKPLVISSLDENINKAIAVYSIGMANMGDL